MNVNTSQLIIAGNKIYTVCPYCGRFIRVNKPFLGTLHFCVSSEERKRIESESKESK